MATKTAVKKNDTVDLVEVLDSKGFALKPGFRVERIKDGVQGTVVRTDSKSQRAVVAFDDGTGAMRSARSLKALKNKGHVIKVKDLTEAKLITRTKAQLAKAAAAE